MEDEMHRVLTRGLGCRGGSEATKTELSDRVKVSEMIVEMARRSGEYDHGYRSSWSLEYRVSERALIETTSVMTY